MNQLLARGVFGTLLVCCACTFAHAADGPARREWKVGDATREALVYVPELAKTEPSPVIFVFHGHGGTMKQFAAKFVCEKNWPQAICVYPQGLNSAGTTDPEGKKPGWQHAVGDQADRDLKFFDAMLADLKKDYKVDDKRIYSTGFSNGGGFTFVLWEARYDVLAAVAPCAGGGERHVAAIKPKPAMIVAGEKDPIVPIDSQKRMIEALLKINHVDPEPQKWSDLALYYPSKTGTPVLTYVHPAAHMVPDAVPALVVKFFKQQSRN